MSLYIPYKNDEKHLYATVMQIFFQFGKELSVLFRSKLDPILGQDWVDELSREYRRRVNLDDISFVLGDISRNVNSKLRLCVPRNVEIYREIDNVLRERNKWAHNDVIINIENTINTINQIKKLSSLLEIEFESQLAQPLKALENLKDGKNIEVDIKSNLKEKIDESRVKIQTLREESNSIQQQLASTEEERLKLQGQLINRNKVIANKEAILQKVVTEKNILNIVITELQAKLTQIESEKKDQENLSKSFEKIQEEELSSKMVVNHIVNPGEIWPGLKGDTKLTLSPRFKDIYLSGSCAFLSDVLGNEAKSLANIWLNIKPNGGSIWIDKYGRVTSYLGENLCFLGQLTNDDLKKFADLVESSH